MMGAGWIINVIVAEWIIRRKVPNGARVQRQRRQAILDNVGRPIEA
jgi:hypothetical protein